MTTTTSLAGETAATDLDIRVRDGLRLRVRRYPAPGSRLRPVLCLPGLTRNGRDFTDLAVTLAAAGPLARPVYTLDFRGRGHSEWDRDWKNYAVPVEALDVIDVLTALDLHDVAMVGTSRGGLVTMVLAAMQPSAIGLAVLNDIGPVLEPDGLVRIAGYVGRMPLPRTWQEAAQSVRDLNQRQFPSISPATWDAFARQVFNEKNGRPAPGYDPMLKNSMSVLDGPMPKLWPQFEALARVPVLVLRGETSDLLSEATVSEMRVRHPRLESYTVPGEGHAPLLKDAATNAVVAEFIAAHDHAVTRSSAAPRGLAGRILHAGA
ncbi:MAG: alpha/beta hydrolase [Hyphomicrobiaceae bacterium]|nr:alpha/beta hydrolase [Hyphomicrobiaceae bacterium]